MNTPDLQIHKTPWAPGWWTISALTGKGRIFWAREHFAEIGWNLGSGAFSQLEVDAVMRAAPAGLVVEVEGEGLRKREVQAHG